MQHMSGHHHMGAMEPATTPDISMSAGSMDSMDSNSTMENGMTSSMMTMVMTMTFNNKLPFHLLFEATEIKSRSDLFMGCLLVFFLGIAYEYVKFMRLRILDSSCCAFSCCKCSIKKPNTGEKCVTKLKSQTPKCCSSGDVSETYVTSVDLSDDDEIESIANENTRRGLPFHFIDTALHGVQLIFSYVIMLAVMTYNVWIVFSIVIGCIFGYFVCNWPKGKRQKNSKRMKMLVQNTDCH